MIQNQVNPRLVSSLRSGLCDVVHGKLHPPETCSIVCLRTYLYVVVDADAKFASVIGGTLIGKIRWLCRGRMPEGGQQKKATERSGTFLPGVRDRSFSAS